MPALDLHFQTVGNPDNPPMLIIHGLFGSGRNWQAIARQLPDYFIYLLDLRNHGHSPHAKEMSFQLMSEDIGRFIHQHKLGQCPVIAHSMGGKTACWLELNWPETFSHLMVVDIVPRPYSHNFDEKLNAMKSVDLTHISNRQDADKYMAQTLNYLPLRQFLLQNLIIENKQARWRIDLDTFTKASPGIVGYPPTSGLMSNIPTLFIDGELSNYIQPEDHKLIKTLFPNACVETIANASHWVHAEFPDLFVKLVLNFLKE